MGGWGGGGDVAAGYWTIARPAVSVIRTIATVYSSITFFSDSEKESGLNSVYKVHIQVFIHLEKRLLMTDTVVLLNRIELKYPIDGRPLIE